MWYIQQCLQNTSIPQLCTSESTNKDPDNIPGNPRTETTFIAAAGSLLILETILKIFLQDTLISQLKSAPTLTMFLSAISPTSDSI